MNLIKKALLIAGAALLPAAASAKVELPKFFTDSMVIQQNAELTIPGKTKKNAIVKITPSWSGETVKVKVDKKGNFTAKLHTPAAGGPYTILFDDGSKTQLNDILAGEVWFCSGQSNMEMPVEGWGRVMDYRNEVASANYPNVRLLQITKDTDYAAQDDADVNMGGWRSATPQSVHNFSAIGYFFGRGLNGAIDVPVGIIDCTWGGTPVEAWSSFETIERCNEFPAELASIKASGYDSDQMKKDYEARVKAWQDEVIPQTPAFNVGQLQAGWKSMTLPAQWETTELPSFDGVVWLQREVNLTAAEAGKPATLSLCMIDDEDITYVNGKEVGRSWGYNNERRYDIPADLLREGSNVISVRVVDTGGEGGIWGKAENLYLEVAGKKLPLAGAWQYDITADFAKNPAPVNPVNPNYPTVLYNAMMHPATVMPVRGCLWYQGCANVGRDQQYAKLFKAMVEDWRKDWNNPEMPFYFVQLAGWLQPKRFQPDSEWAALREAQKSVLSLPNTGMAVAIDLGNPNDIHPKNKQEVARRLLALALDKTYGIPTDCEAPTVKDVKANGRYLTLTFNGPVTIFGGGQGFIVKDRSGRWGEAYGRQVAPNAVEVVCDEVATPVEVRYLWADYPEGNLRSVTGLPVAPFRAKP